MTSYSVLHVAETLKGGIASYLNEIVAAQVLAAPAGVIILLAPDDQVQELRLPTSVRLVTFAGRGARARRTVAIISMLCKIVPTLQPDIIHAHSSFAGIAVRIAARIFRLPALVVYCAHGWAFDRAGSAWKNSLIAKFEALLARWSDAVICISSHDYRTALDRHLPAEKLVLIPNAIARDTVVGGLPEWPAQRRRFVFVGRLDRQKGADVFIAAMRRLSAEGFAYVVGAAVVGAEAMPELPSNVVATGWLAREEVQAYLHSADVVVVPSRWEGFGLVALEAMRAAKPVIASRVGGLSELVSDGVTGRLVAAGDVDELESALRAACAHDWAAWGEAGKERFLQSYTAERLHRQLAELYEKLLAGERFPVVEQPT